MAAEKNETMAAEKEEIEEMEAILVDIRDEPEPTLQGEGVRRMTLRDLLKIRTPKSGDGDEGADNDEEVTEEVEQKELKTINLVVDSILLAGMFAGTTTVPGGTDEYGMPILGVEGDYLSSWFQVYELSVSAAFSLSSLSLFLHFCILVSKGGKAYATAILVNLVGSLTLWAIIALNVAFLSAGFFSEVQFKMFVDFYIAYAVCVVAACFAVLYFDRQCFLRMLYVLLTPVRIILIIMRDIRMQM